MLIGLAAATRMPTDAKVGDPLAFYSVAATIIPVLFVALMYEAKVLELVRPKVRYIVAQTVGLLAVLAEANAFRVLASQEPAPHDARAISSVMLILGLTVFAQPLLGSIDNDLPARNKEVKALDQALRDALVRLTERETQSRVVTEELEKLKHEMLDEVHISRPAAEARVSEFDRIVERLQEETVAERRKVDEFKAVSLDLARRVRDAGVPIPAWAVVGTCLIGGILGILSIYDVL